MALVPTWSHEITLPPATTSASTARRFVQGHLTDHALPLLVDDVVLVASELATNAIAHARSQFTVSLTATSGTVTLSVSDGSALLPRVVDTAALDTTGRGMAIVDGLSREWGVLPHSRRGKAVWAAFDANQPQ